MTSESSDTRVSRNAANYSKTISDTTYDNLRRTGEYVLPALAAFYFGLSQIWGFPYGEEVVGSIALLNIFLGVVIGAFRSKYNNSDAKYDGEMIVSEDDERKLYRLELNEDVESLDDKKEISFKVVR